MALEPTIAGIYMFGGNFAPRNYMFCDGKLLPIAQYTALFAIIGTTYGGDGQVTFALPDLRGRIAVHVGGGGAPSGLSPVQLGEQSGSNSVTVLNSNMPMHSHPVAASNNVTTGDPTGGVYGSLARGTALNVYDTTVGSAMSPGMVGFAGGSNPVQLQSPFLGINYIIAVEGIFPSRN